MLAKEHLTMVADPGLFKTVVDAFFKLFSFPASLSMCFKLFILLNSLELLLNFLDLLRQLLLHYP